MKGSDLKEITGDEDFGTPIFFLFFFSMLFVSEATALMKNLNLHGSIILTKPILFSDNFFETLGNFCWFFLPASIFLSALIQKQIYLKITYSIGAFPLVLTSPVISKLGYKSLYVVNVIILFVVIMCLMKYLINTTELYKKALKQKKETDNQADEPDGKKVGP